ncbi:MAG: SPOR domain-containing protein [Longimicrobiales bacterium]|nr:SPOR domain-containing protein [Longimicrobiales bacterium]
MRLLTALAVTVMLAACGGDEPETPDQTPGDPQPQSEAATPQPEPTARSDSPQPEPDPARQPSTPAPETAAPPGGGTEGALYTVQVAAFINVATAREWAGRLRSQALPVWTAEARVDDRRFHRLRVGALPSLEEAERLADRISARYHWPVWVAPVTATDRLPGGVVERSRQLLSGPIG